MSRPPSRSRTAAYKKSPKCLSSNDGRKRHLIGFAHAFIRKQHAAKAKNLTLAAPRDRRRGCRAAESPASSRPEGSAHAFRGRHRAAGRARHRISPACRQAIPARALSWSLAARACLRAEQPRSACNSTHGRDWAGKFAPAALRVRAAPEQTRQQAAAPTRHS